MCMAAQTSPPMHDSGRHIPLEAVFNFRDLGGYPTADGRHTRWQQVYRADGLNRLTAADVETLRPLGLRTVIDLRTQAELDERGRFPLESHAVEYHHLPILDVVWDADELLRLAVTEEAAFMFERYKEMLDIGEHHLADALRILAQPSGHPAVFHCAAGKDRTGIVAGILLSLLGVSDEVIAHDYSLSRDGMGRMREWYLASYPEMAERMEKTKGIMLSAEPETMHAFLGHIRDHHGSTAAYVESLGVGPDVIAELQAALLE